MCHNRTNNKINRLSERCFCLIYLIKNLLDAAKILHGSKNRKMLLGWRRPPVPPKYMWNKPLVRLHLASLGFISIYNNIFIIMINADIVTSGIGSDNMSVLEDYIIFLIWTAWVLFNFICRKNKGFQSGASLEMPPLSHSMEDLVYIFRDK